MRVAAAVAAAVAITASGVAAQEILVKDGETIAFLGDSITELGVAGRGYVHLVASGLEANGIKIKIIGAGIHRHTSNDMLERLERDVLSKKPHWMTLSCGVNDTWLEVPLDTYKKNITTILDRCQAAGVKVTILTATMIGKDPANVNNQRVIPQNEFLRVLAKERKCPLADLHADMLAILKNAPANPAEGEGNSLTFDGVHMNEAGNRMMALGVLRAFGLNEEQIRKARTAWSAPAQVQLANRWSFDGNLADTSGNGNHGTLRSGSETYVAGKFGKAISLSGLQEVTNAAASGLPTAGTADWSMNVWAKSVNMRAGAGGETLAYFGRAVGQTSSDRSIANNYGRPGVWINSGPQFQFGAWPADGLFHMYTITYTAGDPSRATYSAYIDSVLKATAVGSYLATLANAEPKIRAGGSITGSTASNYSVALDEFTIWSGVLGQAEIVNLYNCNEPAAPTGLRAMGGNTMVVLNWTGSVWATGYNVKRSLTSGSGYVKVGTASIATYSDTTVANGTRYYYVVSATNGVGESAANSSEAGATPKAGVKLDQTISFSLGATLSKLVGDASFADTAAASSWLAVTYSSDNTSVATVDAISGSVTIVGLGTAHILANQAGNATYNAAPQVSQTLTVTERVLDLTPGAANTGYGTTPALPSAYTGQGNMLLVANTPAVKTTAGIGWEDVAGTKDVSSLPTNIFNDNAAPTLDHNGTPYAAILHGSGQQRVAFSGLANMTIDYIRVWYDGLDRKVNSLSVYATSASLASGDLLNSTKYTRVYTGSGTLNAPFTGMSYTPVYRDFAISANNTKIKSILFSFAADSYSPRLYEIQVYGTPLTVPAAPTGLGSTPGSGVVALSWTASPTATGYNVKRSTTSGSGYAIVGTTASATTYSDNTVVNGTTYYYVVSAINEAGEGSNSSEVSAKPTVAKGNQSISFSRGATLSKTMIDLPFADTAAATSTLPVTYSSDNTSVATVDASNGTVTIVGVGTAHILANQAGNDGFRAAPEVSQTLTVTPPPQVVTWPAPTEEKAFEDCTLQVEDKPVFAYTATANRSAAGHGVAPEQYGFSCFDFTGTVRVVVKTVRKLESVTIRPASAGIKAVVKDDTASFILTRPCKLSVEFNGSENRPLILFAGAPESYPGGVPRPGQPGVRYFAPGIYEVGEIRLADGETLYIAGGAVVKGKVVVQGAKGVRILGRGILDGSIWEQGTPPWAVLVSLDRCSDVEIRGLVFRDSACWTLVPSRCERVTVSDVRILNYRKNSDGINSVGCKHVVIDDCFVRNYDDSIVVKALKPDMPDPEDIRVSRCVVWCDWGVALGMTYEARTKTIRNLRFTDCDVIHAMACRAAIAVKNGDAATVSDVRFENIRVEDARVMLLELLVDKDMFSGDVEGGRIQGVVFKDVFLTGGQFVPSQLVGLDDQHAVEDVTFENLRIHGKPVANAEEGKIAVNPHVRNVRFLPKAR